MITEFATLKIDPLRAADFEAAVAEGVGLFKSTQGCHGMALDRQIEAPEIYVLRIQWETLEHHTIGFRQSETLQKWRAIVGPFFVEPPHVVHVETKATYF